MSKKRTATDVEVHAKRLREDTLLSLVKEPCPNAAYSHRYLTSNLWHYGFQCQISATLFETCGAHIMGIPKVFFMSLERVLMERLWTTFDEQRHAIEYLFEIGLRLHANNFAYSLYAGVSEVVCTVHTTTCVKYTFKFCGYHFVFMLETTPHRKATLCFPSDLY